MFDFLIPTMQPPGSEKITFQEGETITFVGANGSGKTRLTFYLKNYFKNKSHLISAHRALNLDLTIIPGHHKIKLAELHQGGKVKNKKISSRTTKRKVEKTPESNDPDLERLAEIKEMWSGVSATDLVDDFKQLNQVLFSELHDTAINLYEQHKNQAGSKTRSEFNFSKLDILIQIWNEILPNKKITLTEDSIMVHSSDSEDQYKASELSDGERAIFYNIGQVLLAGEKSVLIFDEPELHMHKSVMTPLWSKLTEIRKDCGFIFLTHDLQFAATRSGQKYIIKSYSQDPAWDIEKITKKTGFREEIYTSILGSKQKILFCEGSYEDKDYAVYQACYPNYTVIPREGCKNVIKSVLAMKDNPCLAHLKCAGFIDRDFRSTEEAKNLLESNIFVLPTHEIENLFLIPEIFEKIAKSQGHEGDELEKMKKGTKSEIIYFIKDKNRIEKSLLRYAYDYLKGAMKNGGLSNSTVTKEFEKSLSETDDLDISISKTLESMKQQYKTNIENLHDLNKNVQKRNNEFKNALINNKENIETLLLLYDEKELLNFVMKKIIKLSKTQFDDWIKRVLINNTHPELTATIKRYLPKID